MPTIYPSLIGGNQLNLQKEIETLDPHCAGYHLDVMDNHFVPNLTMGPDVVNAIATVTNRQLWVHLMVENPENIIERLVLPPESIVSFHLETTESPTPLIKRIKEKKWIPSIAISPKTEVAKVFPLLELANHVLIMSVEPGFAGQPFIPEVTRKIEPIIGYANTSGKPITIGIDGGIGKENIGMLVDKGIDHIAIASGIFDHEDPALALHELQSQTGER